MRPEEISLLVPKFTPRRGGGVTKVAIVRTLGKRKEIFVLDHWTKENIGHGLGLS